MKRPYIIDFDTIGDNSSGYLITTQGEYHLPFEVKRIFWVFGTPSEIVRGQHAHFKTEMVLVNLQSSATIEVENVFGEKRKFNLEMPNKGLFLPVMHWSRIFLHSSSILLCMASTDYSESDYIRDYKAFKNIINL